ncbi:acyl carrier protein [Streptomyces boninensis]|uniref:acyl carrier protein n=1 Tax=Streptomyces boninensis TaxID=2039455 RepID=UPI003B20FF56
MTRNSAAGTAPRAVASVSAQEVAGFICERFLPGVSADELGAEYDLIGTAVIDSLGVLQVAAWLEKEHGIRVADAELTTASFGTVQAICATALRAGGAA